MLPKMRGWLLDDQPASTEFEKLRILAAFRIGHQGPLGCQIFLISLPIPSVDLVSPTFVAPTAVNDSLPRRRRHHLGTILSASRPVCRKTGNLLREGCAPEEVPGIPASLYSWGQLLHHRDRTSKPSRPLFFLDRWRSNGSFRHPRGPQLEDPLATCEFRVRSASWLPVDGGLYDLLNHNDLGDLDIDWLSHSLCCTLNCRELILMMHSFCFHVSEASFRHSQLFRNRAPCLLQ